MTDVPDPTDRRTAWLFFAVAVLLYVPGIWWGLPEGIEGRSVPWGTDELGPVGAVNEVYGVFAANNPHFNPQYPLFQYLTQLVLIAPFYVGLWVTGHISTPAPLFPYGLDHPPVELMVLTLLARLSSVLMGAGVVAVAYRTGCALRDRLTGTIGASLVLLLYPMVFYARSSNVDMGALFWTSLGLLVFAHGLKEGATPRRWLLFGVFGALATASKDPSYAAFLAAGAVMFVLHARHERARGSTFLRTLRAPAIAFGAAVAVYVVASGLIFRPSRFVQHVQWITSGTPGLFYFRYPATLAGYRSFLGEFGQQLVDAMGVPLLVATATALIWWGIRTPRSLLWILPAAGVFVCVIVPVRFALLRFVLIIVYVAAFAAADFFARGWGHPRPVFRIVARVAFGAVLIWSAVRAGDLTYQMLFDGRHAAAAWLGAVARPGDRVGHVIFRRAHIPALPPGVEAQAIDPEAFVGLTDRTGPEFILSIPLADYESIHEFDLPGDVYQRLLSGALGYRYVGTIHSPSLFSRRPVTFVNPPVRVFMREDIWRQRQPMRPSTRRSESGEAPCRPGPREVVSADRTKRVEHFAAQKEAGMAPAFQRARIDFVE